MKTTSLLLMSAIIFVGCSKSSSKRHEPIPETLPQEEEKKDESGVLPDSSPEDPKTAPPAYDETQGPKVETLEIDLRAFADASQIKLLATHDLLDFALRSPAALNAMYWPTLKISCADQEKDRVLALVLKPLTSMRLASHADLTGCAQASVTYPKNQPGFYFNRETSQLNWVLQVESADQGTRLFANQTESGVTVLKQGQAAARESVILNAQEIFPADAGSAQKYVLRAVRELKNYQTASLQISQAFWPKLSITCDGVIRDESRHVVLKNKEPVSTLRLAVQADVSDCKAISVGSDKAASDGTYDDSSFISWTLVPSAS